MSAGVSSLEHKIGEPTWDIAMLFPLQGQWTEEEYLALDTNHLLELVDGCLVVLPMPTPYHQAIVRYLFKKLDLHVSEAELGEVFFAPLPVRLWKGRLREPDVIFVRPARIRDRHKPPEGADLAMEVVSEGEENRARDFQIKREDYARAKIAEYWIVDPQEKQITVLVLSGRKYRVHGVFGLGEEATSVVLSDFAVEVTAVFAAGKGKR